VRIPKIALKNLGIKKSIFGLFSILSALHFAFGLFSFEPLNKLSRDATDLQFNNLQSDLYISKAERAFWNIRLARGRYLGLTPADRESLRLDIAGWNEELSRVMGEYLPHADSSSEKKELSVWENSFEHYSKNSMHYFYLVDTNKLELARTYEKNAVLPFGQSGTRALGNLDDFQNFEAIEKENKVVSNVKRAKSILSLIALLSGIVASIITYLCVNWISKNHQQRLEALGKMSALASISGGISHEVNNPLTVLTMISEQLGDAIEKKDVDLNSLKNLNQKLKTNTARIAKTISSLKAFSRSQDHDPFIPFSIKAMIEQALEFSKDKMSRRGVALTLGEFDKDLSMIGQQSELAHVIYNLVDNALDATEKLPEKWLKISVSDLDDMIEISIIDSGGGVPRHVRDKLFKESVSTKKESATNGLGLSICGRIIAAHDGLIFVDKNFKNTRFIIQLPKKPASSLGVAA
jgi:signal transduction histidine kinase